VAYFSYEYVSGIAMFVSTFTYMSIWVYTGEVGAKRLREAYLQAVLRQDIAFFDNVGAGEVATRIQTDTRDLFPHPCDFHIVLIFHAFLQILSSKERPKRRLWSYII
jgi:hypothetical protein